MATGKLTKAQRIVLRDLVDVAQHEGTAITLKNRFHSAAEALIRRDLVRKFNRFPYPTTYVVTQQGIDEWNRLQVKS